MRRYSRRHKRGSAAGLCLRAAGLLCRESAGHCPLLEQSRDSLQQSLAGLVLRSALRHIQCGQFPLRGEEAMSRWTDQWRDFVRDTSYVHNLREEKISNDQFWRSYGIYDQVLMHSGYPGEILSKISSFISPEATFLDIGAGTGAFAIPLSRKTSQNHCRRSIGISIADSYRRKPDERV